MKTDQWTTWGCTNHMASAAGAFSRELGREKKPQDKIFFVGNGIHTFGN